MDKLVFEIVIRFISMFITQIANVLSVIFTQFTNNTVEHIVEIVLTLSGWIYAACQNRYRMKFEKEQKRREQIALIAEVLADWLAADIRNAEDIRQLNKRSFEMTFWLPDDLSKELNNLFAHEGEKDIRDVLFDVRKYMWKDTKKAGSKLEPHEIVIFKQKKLLSSIE